MVDRRGTVLRPAAWATAVTAGVNAVLFFGGIFFVGDSTEVWAVFVITASAVGLVVLPMVAGRLFQDARDEGLRAERRRNCPTCAQRIPVILVHDRERLCSEHWRTCQRIEELEDRAAGGAGTTER